jgi:hypothetical protein
VRLEGLGQLKKSNDLIGNLTRDLPACSIVPEPTKFFFYSWGETLGTAATYWPIVPAPDDR